MPKPTKKKRVKIEEASFILAAMKVGFSLWQAEFLAGVCFDIPDKKEREKATRKG